MPRKGDWDYFSTVPLRQVALFILVLTTLASGCDAEGPPGQVRDWETSDHAQPATPDPARQSPQGATEAPTEEQIQQAAARLFADRCGSCHGVSGAGDGPQAPTQNMPDLTLAAYHEGHSDADIARVIRMGEGMMPAFGGSLNERGIAALVSHVRTLRVAE